MTDKKLTMEGISRKIIEGFGNDIQVIYSDDNAEQLVFHIRLTKHPSEKQTEVGLKTNNGRSPPFFSGAIGQDGGRRLLALH